MSSLSFDFDYTERSFAIYGDTKACKDKLKELGGKYNSNLKNGPGWIFSKKSKDKIDEWVKTLDIAINKELPPPKSQENDFKKENVLLKKMLSEKDNEINKLKLEIEKLKEKLDEETYFTVDDDN